MTILKSWGSIKEISNFLAGLGVILLFFWTGTDFYPSPEGNEMANLKLEIENKKTAAKTCCGVFLSFDYGQDKFLKTIILRAKFREAGRSREVLDSLRSLEQ